MLYYAKTDDIYYMPYGNITYGIFIGCFMIILSMAYIYMIPFCNKTYGIIKSIYGDIIYGIY